MTMPLHAQPLMTAEEIRVPDLPGKATELVPGRLPVREPLRVVTEILPDGKPTGQARPVRSQGPG